MTTLVPQFDHNKKEYLCERGCCCGPVHSKKATEGIAILTLLCLTFPIYLFVEKIRKGQMEKDVSRRNFNMLLLTPYALICCILLFLGTRKIKPRFIYHFAGLWSLILLDAVLNFLLFTICTILPYSPVAKFWMQNSGVGNDVDQNDEMALRVTFSFAATVALGVVLLVLWFLAIIIRCQTYLQDLENSNRRKRMVELVEVAIE